MEGALALARRKGCYKVILDCTSSALTVLQLVSHCNCFYSCADCAIICVIHRCCLAGADHNVPFYNKLGFAVKERQMAVYFEGSANSTVDNVVQPIPLSK